MSYISLAWTDLLLTASLVVVVAAISYLLELGLGRRVLWSALRMTAQLALIGLVLRALFDIASPWWTGFVALVMVLAAGREVVARQERRFAGPWAYGLGVTSLLFGSTVVMVMAFRTSITPDPWFDPRYTIPILGMLLGNTMTGVALGVGRLADAAVVSRAAIEARLMLGATAFEALRPAVRRALHDGMIPIINAMSAAGLVSLPGMMTGQILAGADPTEAIKYQILIMFLIAGATSLGVLTAVLAGGWRLTDDRHRLRLDRLRTGDRP